MTNKLYLTEDDVKMIIAKAYGARPYQVRWTADRGIAVEYDSASGGNTKPDETVEHDDQDVTTVTLRKYLELVNMLETDEKDRVLNTHLVVTNKDDLTLLQLVDPQLNNEAEDTGDQDDEEGTGN